MTRLLHPRLPFRLPSRPGQEALVLLAERFLRTYPDRVNVGAANEPTIEFLQSTDCKSIAEVGIYRGHTAEAIADWLGGDGELHLFDFAPRVDEVVGRLRARGHGNVYGHGTSDRWLDSYNWSLMQVLRSHAAPLFDYVFIDGAHTWNVDGFTFFLADRLLRVGGFLDFDDAGWSLGGSPTLNPGALPATRLLYTDEQIDEPQVSLVLDILVRRDDRYEELVADKVFRKVAR